MMARVRGENAAANPEHLVAVAHSDPRNWMEPRGDGWVLEQLDAQTAVLARPAAASEWGVAMEVAYQVVAPHYLDLFFRCEVTQPADLSGGALFFFASYLAGVTDGGLHFLADDAGRSVWVRESAQGSYRVNDRALVNNERATLSAALRQVAGEARRGPVTIRADARATHQSVVTAMDVAARLGFTQVDIATVSQSAEE